MQQHIHQQSHPHAHHHQQHHLQSAGMPVVNLSTYHNSLPIATMANVNGVPTLLQLMPQHLMKLPGGALNVGPMPTLVMSSQTGLGVDGHGHVHAGVHGLHQQVGVMASHTTGGVMPVGSEPGGTKATPFQQSMMADSIQGNSEMAEVQSFQSTRPLNAGAFVVAAPSVGQQVPSYCTPHWDAGVQPLLESRYVQGSETARRAGNNGSTISPRGAGGHHPVPAKQQ